MNEEPEELPLLAAPRVSVVLVEDREGLVAAIGDLQRGEGPLAVDAERASGFKYSQRAYLLQFHRKGSGIYLVDPLALSREDLSLLAEFTNQQEWILHAATQDIPCLAELGLNPQRLFDTELISRLLGFAKVGLGAVCEMALGMRLAKEHSAADWSTRPLPESWLNYAALDVDVLPEIREFIIKEVAAQGKERIVEQEMHHLLGFKPKTPKDDRWRGLSNFHDLKETRQLAIAKALWEVRETLAKKLDVSPGRLVPDRSIVHAAVTQPKSKSALANDKAFNGRGARSFLDTWWQAIATGSTSRDLPPMRLQATGIPNHRNWAGKHPEAHARLEAAKVAVAGVAQVNQIPTENTLSPDALRQLCWAPDGFEPEDIGNQLLMLGARKWQVELVSVPISQAWKDAEQGQNPAA